MILKQSRFIAVSISPSFVKVAQVTRLGVVEKLACKAVSSGEKNALVAALEGFQLKHSAALCVLPGEVATTKHLEVPSIDHEEIDAIIALQATRHTPFNSNEIITSYIKIGSPRPNFTNVLLVVVKRDAVNDRLAVMRAASMDIAAVLFVPEAVTRFYAKAMVPKKGERFAILDVAMAASNFMVVADGVPLMARNIPVGIEAVVCDTEGLGQIVKEVKASIDAFEQENGSRPSRLVVTAEHMAIAGIDKLLTDALTIPVEIKSYVSFVKGVKGIKEQLSKEFSDESALDVIATGVAASKCSADLVPQEIKDQRAVALKGRETLKAGILILLVLFFVGGGLLSRVYYKDKFLKDNLLEKYSDQKKEVGLLENMVSKTRVLRDYLQTRQLPLDTVRELFRIIPEEMYLSSIAIDDAGIVTIQGVSESMSRVFSVVTALEESPLFEGVKTKSTIAKKERGKDMAAFEIVFKLSSMAQDAPVKALGAVRDDRASKQGQ